MSSALLNLARRVGATKARPLVFGVATAAVVLIGGYIPVYACQFQNRKAAG